MFKIKAASINLVKVAFYCVLFQSKNAHSEKTYKKNNLNVERIDLELFINSTYSTQGCILNLKFIFLPPPPPFFFINTFYQNVI